MLKKVFFGSLFLCFLIACSTSTKENLVRVSKSLESSQCESSGIDISILKQELIKKGINVYSQSIGDDGIMRPQVCGAPDGKIAIFSINYDNLDDAKKLGFQQYEQE